MWTIWIVVGISALLFAAALLPLWPTWRAASRPWQLLACSGIPLALGGLASRCGSGTLPPDLTWPTFDTPLAATSMPGRSPSGSCGSLSVSSSSWRRAPLPTPHVSGLGSSEPGASHGYPTSSSGWRRLRLAAMLPASSGTDSGVPARPVHSFFFPSPSSWSYISGSACSASSLPRASFVNTAARAPVVGSVALPKPSLHRTPARGTLALSSGPYGGGPSPVSSKPLGVAHLTRAVFSTSQRRADHGNRNADCV